MAAVMTEGVMVDALLDGTRPYVIVPKGWPGAKHLEITNGFNAIQLQVRAGQTNRLGQPITSAKASWEIVPRKDIVASAWN